VRKLAASFIGKFKVESSKFKVQGSKFKVEKELHNFEL
jgi:hypothetical protein